MEYETYKQYFKYYKPNGSIEAHLTFRVGTDAPNPTFAEYMASEIERDLKSWMERPSPGVKYTRDGLIFTVDMFVYKRGDHLDFFDRAFTRLSNDAAFEFIEPLPNQLPEVEPRS